MEGAAGRHPDLDPRKKHLLTVRAASEVRVSLRHIIPDQGERATQEELRQDLKSLFQGAIRVTLEMVLEEELKAMVGARRFERVGSRKDHRNGTCLRRLLTSLGQIDVMVPRSREGGSPADVMGRYRRRSEEVDEMMVEAYVSGVSQRKMGDVTEALLGERVGRSTVSRVAKRLDGL